MQEDHFDAAEEERPEEGGMVPQAGCGCVRVGWCPKLDADVSRWDGAPSWMRLRPGGMVPQAGCGCVQEQ